MEELTAKRAKELTLEVWRYLRDHPEIDRKSRLPADLYSIIGPMEAACPLCEYFTDMNEVNDICFGCPLEGHQGHCPMYDLWDIASYCAGELAKTKRADAAMWIVKAVGLWEVEE